MPEETRHCHRCGWTYTLSNQPGRSESCHQCGADLKVCRNCLSYDPLVAHQCRDRRAELVGEKEVANFCEFFEMRRGKFILGLSPNTREETAREALKKLLGD